MVSGIPKEKRWWIKITIFNLQIQTVPPIVNLTPQQQVCRVPELVRSNRLKAIFVRVICSLDKCDFP